jgi:hypothetical protein
MKPPIRNDEVQDIDYKSLSSLINSICPSCLNHNVMVIEFLRIVLLTSKLIGQITCHLKAIEKTILMVVVL